MDQIVSQNGNKELYNELLLSILSEINNPNVNQELVHIIKTVSSVNHKKVKVEEIYQILQETRNRKGTHKNMLPALHSCAMKVTDKPRERTFPTSFKVKYPKKQLENLKQKNIKKQKSFSRVILPSSISKSSTKSQCNSENRNGYQIHFSTVHSGVSMSERYRPVFALPESQKKIENKKRESRYSMSDEAYSCDVKGAFEPCSILGYTIDQMPSRQSLEITEVFSEDLEKYRKFDPAVNIKRKNKHFSDDEFEEQTYKDPFSNECDTEIRKQLPSKIVKKKNTKFIPMIEKIKGDERDLPSVYSRFVRKSKAVAPIISEFGMINSKQYLNCYSFNDVEFSHERVNRISRDYILGELISDDSMTDTFSETTDNKQVEYEEIIVETKATVTLPMKKSSVSSNVKQLPKKKKTITKKLKCKNSQIEKPNSRKNHRKQSTNENAQITKGKAESAMSMDILPSDGATMIFLATDKLKEEINR